MVAGMDSNSILCCSSHPSRGRGRCPERFRFELCRPLLSRGGGDFFDARVSGERDPEPNSERVRALTNCQISGTLDTFPPSLSEIHGPVAIHKGVAMRVLLNCMSLFLISVSGAAAQTDNVPLLGGGDIPPGMTAPQKIDMPKTGMYPPLGVRCHLVGDAVLELLVAADGSVESAKIVKSAGYRILDDAASSFARKMRYAPATLNGAPVASRIELTLNFNTHVSRQPYCDKYPEAFPDNAAPVLKPQ